MAIPKFPLDPDQIVGRFWVAGTDDDEHSDGVCRVEDGSIEIDVVKPLSKWMEWTEVGDAKVLAPVKDDDDLVVHGALPISPHEVTFLGVRTTARRSSFMPGSFDVPELHRMRAEWCIAGAHIADSSVTFTGVRARFTHFELWARTPAVQLNQQIEPSLKSTVVYTPADKTEVAFTEFDETAATIRVQPGAIVGMPNVWGSAVKTYDWLELDGLSGWTLQEALARFVRPVQVLLTLLAGEQCHVTHLELQLDDSWHSVYGDDVTHDAPIPDEQVLLLDKNTLTLATVGTWCGATVRLSPTPHVVASSFTGGFGTIESNALALTTMAEGMDRVLYPGSLRFTREQVAIGAEALAASDVPQEVSTVLSDALRGFLYEDSYPTRMKRLAEAIAEAVPSCVGKPNKWKGEITSLRVNLAHALGSSEATTDDDLMKMSARVSSLKWALLFRLLLEAGVPADTLSQAVEGSEDYRRDERRWRRRLPMVFPDPDQTPA